MAQIIVLITVFLLGASIGSFLSVVLYRVKNGKKGIIFGQSICPQCKKRLVIIDMIPIASYVLLRGKCRHCKKSISPYYFFLELITGLALLATYLKFPFLIWLLNETPIPDLDMLLKFVFFALYGCFFVAIFFYDLQTKKIPDIFLFPLIAIATLGTLLIGTPNITSAIIAIVAALIIFGGQILISKGKWLGEGDLYIAIAMAIILGWEKFILFVALSYFVGTITTIPLLTTKKATLKTAIAFGPFMVLAGFMCIFFGDEIITWYLNGIIF